MGAPKLKWTSEEEAALKAGIHKYGVGKWSTILKDDEFSEVLRSRSNVDLKDKWRNLNCLITGSGSRQRFRVSMNRNSPAPRYTDEASSRGMQSAAISEETDVYDVTSPESPESPSLAASSYQISRLDDVVLDVIKKLREPRGPSRAAIGQYIEEHYVAPPDFERALAENLRSLTENGRLVKVKHQYRIAPRPICFGAGKGPVLFLGNETRMDAPEFERNDDVIRLSKEQIDDQLENMKYMTASEAAAAAARAVAEAEAAIANAEAATREAEEAEAEAEAAQCFADAAQKSLSFPTIFT